jgi:predicted nucleic acid-binding protein
MKYVLDSNIALKWVLPEPLSDKAIQLRDDYHNAVHELLSPDVFSVEVLHALTRAERQTRIPPGDGWPLWQSVLGDLPVQHAYAPLLKRAYDISSSDRIGVYDCLYVALAEQENCELVTADDRLVNKLQAAFPFIVSLAAMP